jgi:hypothetical protein
VITSTEVKQRYPALASVSDNDINVAINDTECFFDLTRWGCLYTKGHCALVAHMITVEMSAETGAPAQIGTPASMSADGVSVSFATYTPTNFGEAFYMSTPYGLTYLNLMKIVGSGATCVCGV